VTRGEPGIYNIVDDDPAKVRDWVPFAATLLNAPTPPHMELSMASKALGDVAMYVLNEQRGASNAKAKAHLDWQPGIPSWREGFRALYAAEL
jgi:nucleoside-diphosphate-sugar epimerase